MLTDIRRRLIEAMATTGSRDQDVLTAAVEAATGGPRLALRAGQALVAVGWLLCVAAPGTRAGALLALAGGCIWYASSRVLALARDTYREYLSQVSPPPGVHYPDRRSPATG